MLTPSGTSPRVGRRLEALLAILGRLGNTSACGEKTVCPKAFAKRYRGHLRVPGENSIPRIPHPHPGGYLRVQGENSCRGKDRSRAMGLSPRAGRKQKTGYDADTGLMGLSPRVGRKRSCHAKSVPSRRTTSACGEKTPSTWAAGRAREGYLRVWGEDYGAWSMLSAVEGLSPRMGRRHQDRQGRRRVLRSTSAWGRRLVVPACLSEHRRDTSAWRENH